MPVWLSWLRPPLFCDPPPPSWFQPEHSGLSLWTEPLLRVPWWGRPWLPYSKLQPSISHPSYLLNSSPRHIYHVTPQLIYLLTLFIACFLPAWMSAPKVVDLSGFCPLCPLSLEQWWAQRICDTFSDALCVSCTSVHLILLPPVRVGTLLLSSLYKEKAEASPAGPNNGLRSWGL